MTHGVGKRRKKRRTHVPLSEDDYARTPKSFVIASGDVGHLLHRLVRDLRRIMEPHTASNLQERKGNRLKDFVQVAGPLHVTHLLLLSRSDTHVNLRVGRLPRGPTLHFQVLEYALASDVLNAQARPKSPGSDFKFSPLVVLNNFGDGRKDTTLMASMFQNLFPPINVQKVRLSEARRVVLFHLDSETREVELRHYTVAVKPVGISKSVKQLLTTNLPDLNQFEDVGDYVLRGAYASESDVEDAESTVTLPARAASATGSAGTSAAGASKTTKRPQRAADQRAVRLAEIGPRLRLRLVKIQDGLCDGEVIFHQFVTRTKEQVREAKKKREERDKERARRREEQELNVQRKRQREDGDDGEEEEDDAMQEEDEGEYGDGDDDDDGEVAGVGADG
ncbi:hypothetical protein HK405_010758 [Cladochytrium tenue]|nr:hypothetical protein HK405_010758 [Cladochytrium tenue]